MRRTIGLCVFLALSMSGSAWACLWYYGTNLHGEKLAVATFNPESYVRRLNDHSEHARRTRLRMDGPIFVIALGAIAAFRPADLPVVPGSLLVAATMTAIVLPTAALWAAAGGWLGSLLNGERSRRGVSLLLAALLVTSVAAIWR